MLVIVGAVVAVGAILLVKPPFGEWIGATTDSNSQVVTAITRTEEVALVSLGIEGIRERNTEDGQFLFITIPNSRAAFLRYSFEAKLGIDANGVVIDDTDYPTIVVNIPEFIVIGMDNQHVEVAAENNDVLSWTTPEIDKVSMVNDIFNDALKAQYLEKNGELLRDQTIAFYTDIVNAIDPSVTLEFVFANQ